MAGDGGRPAPVFLGGFAGRDGPSLARGYRHYLTNQIDLPGTDRGIQAGPETAERATQTTKDLKSPDGTSRSRRNTGDRGRIHTGRPPLQPGVGIAEGTIITMSVPV